MRRSIMFLLIATATTLLVLFVSGGLWGLLAATGDRAAARGAKGVALVATACWGMSFIALVIALAVASLRSDDGSSQK
jgi:preprotein translocase subunit SecG